MVQIKSLVLGTALLVQLVSASSYASSGGNDGAIYLGSTGGSGGSASDDSSDLGNVLSMANFVQSGPSYQMAGGSSVPAAIQTKRTVEVKPVAIANEGPIEPHIVDVGPSYQPVTVVFRSSSNPIMVQQIHTPSQATEPETTQSEDTPHRVAHQVTRPIIQEVREIITPYRRVLQEIRPVQEEVRTVVAKAEGSKRVAGPGGEGVVLANAGNGLGAGSSGHGSGLGNGGASGYGSGAYASAAASVPAPSYSRGRRSSVRGTQRKSYQRAVAAKRQQKLYASSL